ncbi:MAG: glycosyl hydrolase, partial [Eubacteriales bacterium]
MKKLLAYTRVAKEQIIYSAKLAASLHLALEIDGKFRPLNNNYGILFAKATENADGSINAKSLASPSVFRRADGGFGVVAVP